jgi:RNA polymerase sigma-70 factor (sigma-E family)
VEGASIAGSEVHTGSSHEAILDLYEAHGGEVRRLAYLLTGDRDEADDLMQEAFARLIGRYQYIRNREAVRSYLLRTVVNVSNSRLRRLRLERLYVRTLRPAESYLPDLAERDSVMRRLQLLPRRQKVVVVLRYCADLSEQQTAEVMGVSLRAVKSLVARALQALRAEEAVDETVG